MTAGCQKPAPKRPLLHHKRENEGDAHGLAEKNIAAEAHFARVFLASCAK